MYSVFVVARATLLFSCLLLSSCGDRVPQEEATPADRVRGSVETTTEQEATPVQRGVPGYPRNAEAELIRAPREYEHVVPRLVLPIGPRFSNMRYEANNLTMRGTRLESTLYAEDGVAIAQRWREAAVGTRGVFAVRDALYSQQDHPIAHAAVSVMMPPAWVTVAVQKEMLGESVEPVVAPAIEDDAAWAALATRRDMFGTFPPSETLHATAIRPRTALAPERLLVTNARRTIRMLAEDAKALVDAMGRGAEAVAQVGAERIAQSDLRYFGRRLREENIILVSVENPTIHEVRDEHKGFRSYYRDLSDEAILIAKRAVYRRRLEDGPIALERYNCAERSDRDRAVAILQEIVPSGSRGHDVWVWINGGLDSRLVTGESGAPHAWKIREAVERAPIEASRVRYLSKPHERFRGDDIPRAFFLQARRYQRLELAMPVVYRTRFVRRLIQEAPAYSPDAPVVPSP